VHHGDEVVRADVPLLAEKHLDDAIALGGMLDTRR
jgi:hypothetical protein